MNKLLNFLLNMVVYMYLMDKFRDVFKFILCCEF